MKKLSKEQLQELLKSQSGSGPHDDKKRASKRRRRDKPKPEDYKDTARE